MRRDREVRDRCFPFGSDASFPFDCFWHRSPWVDLDSEKFGAVRGPGGARRRPRAPARHTVDGTLVLDPGGLHVMCVGLDGPLTEGQEIELEFTLERAGRIETIVVVSGP